MECDSSVIVDFESSGSDGAEGVDLVCEDEKAEKNKSMNLCAIAILGLN